MMGAQPNDFRYFMTLDNKRLETIFAPEGWDENSVVSYTRSDYYSGLIRTMALPLEFVLDGADILRKAYYTYGIEAEVRFEVEQLQKGLNLATVWEYKQVFRGDVDFSEFRDYKDHVSVTLMESGTSRNIKAYEGVKYEYPLFGNDVVNIVLPGVAFHDEGNFFIGSTIEQNFNSMPPIRYANDLNSQIVAEGEDTEEHNGKDLNVDNRRWFVRFLRAQRATITGRIKGQAITKLLQGSSTFYIEIRDQDDRLYWSSPGIASPSGGGEKDFDQEISLIDQDFEENKHLSLVIRGSGDADNFCKVLEGSMVLSFDSVSDPSNCKGIPALAMFKRIINRISPGSVCDSRLLAMRYPTLIFTSGDGIREIVDAKIKITFKEFFETIAGIDDAAFGLENNVAVLENGNYFFRNLKILDLGEVKECSIQPAQQLLFNSIKIGYNDGNTDDTDGKQEYNSTQIWQLPITRVQKEKNWLSPTRADQYGIEKIRVEYNIKTAKKTNDTPSDNNPFMIYTYLDGDNYRPVLGSSYNSVTGLDDGNSAYNLELTPKQNLLRKQGYLAGTMDRMPGRYINFASGEKNTELATVKDGRIVKEKENILSSGLTGKYFIPNMVSIVTKMPHNTMWIMDNLMFGYIQFSYRGTTLKGYLMDVPIDVAKNTEQTLKLLLTDDNNLLNLA